MRGLVIVVIAGCGVQSSFGYLQPPPAGEQRVALGSLGDRLAASLETAYRKRVDHPPPPVRLTPSDGSELALQKLAADVHIDGPVAHTELHFTFHNPEDRIREGRFAITLPAGANVTRFAMKIATEWREAKIVARQQGREVYERFLHHQTDPALLEQDLGNQFSARVYPISAGEDKEIIVAYDEQLTAAAGYVLPLRALPEVGQVSGTIDDNGHRRMFSWMGAEPDDVRATVEAGDDAVAGGDAFVARVELPGSTTEAPLDHVLYLVDTSASRAPVMARQVELLRSLLITHAPDDTVAIAAFDQAPVELYRGPAKSAWNAVPKLFEHGALGASNLGAALERAAASGMTRVVIIGDGVATAGEHEPAKLAALAAGLARIDAVQVGATVDRTVLGAIVRAGRAPGAILDGEPDAIARGLRTALGAPLPIAVDGATTWPATTRDVAPGQPAFVFGLRTGGDGPLVIHVGDRAVRVAPRTGDATRVRRAVARAELAELTDRMQAATGDAQRALGDQIEKLALEHSLISSRTSLIVLETDWDEQRFLGYHDADDNFGVSFSGSTSLDNQYIVEGVNAGSNAELCLVSAYDPDGLPGATRPYVRADVLSPLALDLAAESIRSNAFALRTDHYSEPPPERTPHYRRPYTGDFARVMSAIAKHDSAALELATAWQLREPGDVAAIVALGEALEARGAGNLAARAYGSIADLYPNRAELLRATAERLDRIGGARALAIDLYRRAIRERPDQASTYRLLAYALLRADRADEALATLLDGATHATRPSIQHVLAEDAGVIGAAIVARTPARRSEIASRLPLGLATTPTLRFVLTWETDANDVDLHVRDGKGGHAYYKGMQLSSGGRLIDDVTDGFGPEMFVVERPDAFPYKLAAHYYSKGPMGVGLGSVQVIRHDGAGTIVVEDRPFVIQNDEALVELGAVLR